MPAGFTLAESLVALVVMGIVLAIGLPRLGTLRDAAAVRAATTEVESAIATARQLAIARRRRVAVRVDALRGTAAVFAQRDTFQLRRLRERHHVTVRATRDSIAFTPLGLGYGAANTSIIVARGQFEDTVVLSRLGRMRQ
ncbi:MAG TPA: type II secretion system protein [Gemmatimonadaceae bacterium]|nr:type II secretion system protein [Gemmatimonadaceae bacterium]